MKRPYTYYTPYSEHNTEVGNLRLSDSSERGSSKKSTGNAEVLSTREDASKKFGNGIIPRLSTPKGGRPDWPDPARMSKWHYTTSTSLSIPHWEGPTRSTTLLMPSMAVTSTKMRLASRNQWQW